MRSTRMIVGAVSAFLLGTLAAQAVVAVDEKPAAPTPVVSWEAVRPAGAQPGDVIDFTKTTFTATGSDAALQTLKIMPSGFGATYNAVPKCKVTWAKDEQEPNAVSLLAKGESAYCGAVLQCGDGPGTLAETQQLTLRIAFKLTAAMAFGGGNPPWELAGNLMCAPVPGKAWDATMALGINGRGKGGADKRLPFFKLTGVLEKNSAYFSTYTPVMDGELELNKWYTLVVVWDGTQAGDNNGQPFVATDTKRVRMWLDGKELPVKRTGHPNASPSRCVMQSPLLVGGNRDWNNAPITLARFAVYNVALTSEQVAKLK